MEKNGEWKKLALPSSVGGGYSFQDQQTVEVTGYNPSSTSTGKSPSVSGIRERLRTLLEPCGPINRVVVLRTQLTKAYVAFASGQGAQTAMSKLQGVEFMQGKLIIVAAKEEVSDAVLLDRKRQRQVLGLDPTYYGDEDEEETSEDNKEKQTT